MASSEGRRSFLLGITLNELSFIMFFLLMFISSATLQKTNKQLQQEIEQKNHLQAGIVQVEEQRDEAFKRLQLIESRLIRVGGFSAAPNEQQLEQLFTRLQAVKGEEELQQTINRLHAEQKSLRQYKQFEDVIKHSELAGSSLQQLEQFLQQTKQSRQELGLLKGRLAYSQKKLKNSGLGYPPCWADSSTGAVEYLYTVTLYEQYMQIEAAWPVHRKVDIASLPGAMALVGQQLKIQQLRQGVKALFAWSQAHNCRHFVRIKDDKYTSKEAFKKQMLVLEDYFYKYLLR